MGPLAVLAESTLGRSGIEAISRRCGTEKNVFLYGTQRNIYLWNGGFHGTEPGMDFPGTERIFPARFDHWNAAPIKHNE